MSKRTIPAAVIPKHTRSQHKRNVTTKEQRELAMLREQVAKNKKRAPRVRRVTDEQITLMCKPVRGASTLRRLLGKP